jgi:hypothetical protein
MPIGLPKSKPAIIPQLKFPFKASAIFVGNVMAVLVRQTMA